MTQETIQKIVNDNPKTPKPQGINKIIRVLD